MWFRTFMQNSCIAHVYNFREIMWLDFFHLLYDVIDKKGNISPFKIKLFCNHIFRNIIWKISANILLNYLINIYIKKCKNVNVLLAYVLRKTFILFYRFYFSVSYFTFISINQKRKKRRGAEHIIKSVWRNSN